MKVRVLHAALLLLACSPGGPAERAEEDEGGKLVVYAVCEPLRYFAERVGGDAVRVRFPAPADVADPAYWSPSPETVADYGAADLALLNGGGYARWVARASLRERRLVDTSAAFRDRFVPLDHEVTHAHGPEGDHSHAGVATTFWLDLGLAREQARAVAEAFARARPEHAAGFRERHAALDGELARLDARLGALSARLRGQALFYSHPVYGYLERRYGLAGTSFHWEPAEPPPEEDWARLAGQAGAWMLWEAEPLPATRARLEALGVRVVVFEPAGGHADEADFLDRMRANLDRLEAALHD